MTTVARRSDAPAAATSGSGRVPGLDGIRGVAVTLVVLSHIGWPGFSGGGASGVTVFFTLSGFLITSLLLTEYDRSGRIDLAAFWVRRGLRLLPALWFYVAVTAIVYLALGLSSLREMASMALPPLFYYSNWTAENSLGPFNHTWSLAVEEQFYIIWPLIVLFALVRLPRRWVPILLIGLAVASVWWRLHLGLSSDDGYYAATRRTDTNAFSLLTGAALAAAIRVVGRPRRLPAFVVDVALVLLIAIPVALGKQFQISGVTAPVYVTVLTLVLVVGSIGGSRSLLDSSSLRFLGRVSYGWYLWHWLAYQLVRKIDGYADAKDAWGIVAAVTSLGAAVVSYYAVERPALKFKHRFERASLADKAPRSSEPAVSGRD